MIDIRTIDINKKVDFIGIGAQKSATSWIAKCLSVHPEVFVADCKETHFFSDDEKYTKGIDYYHKYFPDSNDTHSIGEYSTSYLTSQEAAERIKLYSPDMKLIACLRNPVDRAFSQFLHLKFKSKNNADYSLRDMIKIQPQIIENGMYGKSLSYYFKLFPAHSILVLFYEDIRNNPQDFMKRIYNFIGVDSSFIPHYLNTPYNTSAARSSSHFKRINRIYFSLRQHAIGRGLIRSLRHIGINALTIDSILRSLKTHKQELLIDDRKYIQSLYQDDINELSSLLGVDLSSWQKHDQGIGFDGATRSSFE